MRRLVVPLLFCAMLSLATVPAGSQVLPNSIYDTLGFGISTVDTIRALPGDSINLPVFLSTDSIVTGMSMLFRFDTEILWPQIAFYPRYDSVLNAGGFVPDSADWQETPFLEPGLWEMLTYLSTKARETWNPSDGPPRVLYNFNDIDALGWGHARLFLAPTTFDPGSFTKPYFPGGLGTDGGGAVVVYIRFWVNPDAQIGDTTIIRLEDQNEDLQRTELAEEWFDETVDTIRHTEAVIPTYLRTVFIVDSADTEGPGPLPNENDPPVLVLGTTTKVFNIKQGEQVSFAVSATDDEGGEVRITANGGTLPPNASLSPSNPVVGGGGSVSGTFAFKPDISQEGVFAFSFEARDDSGAVDVDGVTVNVAPLDIDRLFTSSADDLAPEGGVPGLSEVMVPINVVTKKIIYGIQFDMTYNANNFDLDSVVTSDRIPEWVVYDNIGIDPGFLRVVTFGLANDSMVAGSTSAVLYLAFTVDEFAEIGRYPLNIYNAWESIDPDPNVPSLDLVTDSGVLYVDRWGDVNLDRRIDVADLVNTVAYIIGTYGLSRRQFATADIVINDTVNVVDLVGIINTIFGLPVTPAPAQQWQGDFATLKIAHDEIPGAGFESEMQILADMPATVAGVELEIQYNPYTVKMLPPQVASGSEGFRLTSNDNGAGLMRVLVYSNRPWNEEELIREGLSDIVKLPFISKGRIPAGDDRHVRITRAVISTGAARNIPVEGVGGTAVPSMFELYQNRPNPFNPFTTIDFYIDGSDGGGTDQVVLEVFNILGQRIRTLIDEALPPGLHSVVWDGTDDGGDRAASGIYLYRLKIGDESATRKMMLLK